MYASCRIGLLALRQGDLPRALYLLERAMGICQEAYFLIWLPRTAAALGAAYTLCGRATDAVPLLTQALEQTIATGTRGVQALCSLPLAEAQMLANSLEEANALTERTLVLSREHQERGHEAYALRLLGDITVRREPPQAGQAEVHYLEALALAAELDMLPLQAHCHRGLGMLYRETGRQAQARTELLAALTLYRAMEMTFWLPATESALAHVQGEVAPTA